jgi:alpha-tubulin suppressor-like RCC1 family protein
VTAIASGASHVCALTSEGVECWGANTGGQLGNGSTMDSSSAVQVQQLGVASAVAAGGEHSCAIVAGALHCWGWNAYGQIGDGTTDNRPFATAVPALASGVTAVSAGAATTCALAGGAVQCWGYGQYGQIGDGATTDVAVPTSVAGLGSGQLAVSTGCMFACGLSGKGGVTCWGDDQSGQIGDDDPALLDKNVPTAVVGIASGATAIATGTAHACAIVGGAVSCWGWDVSGQLGNDVEIDSASPVAVLGL